MFTATSLIHVSSKIAASVAFVCSMYFRFNSFSIFCLVGKFNYNLKLYAVIIIQKIKINIIIQIDYKIYIN